MGIALRMKPRQGAAIILKFNGNRACAALYLFSAHQQRPHVTHGHKKGGGATLPLRFFRTASSVGSIDPPTSETALPEKIRFIKVYVRK